MTKHPLRLGRRGFHHATVATLGSLAMALVGCSAKPEGLEGAAGPAGQEPPAAPRPAPRILSSKTPSTSSKPDASDAQGAPLLSMYDMVSKEMYGFVAGNGQSATVIHVVFDALCPHCGSLWVASQSLWPQVKFVWLPVPMLRPDSLTNGALIMASPNPVEAMNVHEHKLLNSLPPLVPIKELVARGQPQVEHNRNIAAGFRLNSVPMLLHRRTSGEVVSTVGGMGAPEIMLLIG